MTGAEKRTVSPEVELAEIEKYIDPKNKDALNDAVMKAASTVNSLLLGRRIKGVHFDFETVDASLISQPDNMEAVKPLGLTWCWWKGLSWCSNPDKC